MSEIETTDQETFEEKFFIVWAVYDAGDRVRTFTTLEKAEAYRNKLLEEALELETADEASDYYIDNLERFFTVSEDRVYI